MAQATGFGTLAAQKTRVSLGAQSAACRPKGVSTVTTGELLDRIKAIIDAHPEAEHAQVWSYSEEVGFKFQVQNLGWDKKHKPHRLKLED